MRKRILGVFAVLIAVIGLSAPAASASPTVGPESWCNPCHLWANDHHGLGIFYPGLGRQAYVQYPAATLTVWNLGNNVVEILNHNGYCLEMRDAAHRHAVVEETCSTGNKAEEFTYQVNKNVYVFDNLGYSDQYLGVDCHTAAFDLLWGIKDARGTCVGWWHPKS